MAFSCKLLRDFFGIPANSGAVMKQKKRTPEQGDRLRPRLVDIINIRHEFVKLAALIDWMFFEKEWAGTQTERERLDRSVCRGERPRRQACMVRICSLDATERG